MIDLSICIVSFMTRELLRDCLNSINNQPSIYSTEIIIVDNGSSDGTLEMLKTDFPQIQLIQNSKNLGFTYPMNQALRAAQGRYLVQLNPDTLMIEDALRELFIFMQAHPEVGICGPKVLNRDGTLQKQCRRGEPRPLAVIGHFLRLGKIFPKNKSLNEYLLNYLDEDEANPVAGVAGSCMMIRREVIDQIGYLDEQYFAYQEDADYCRRARDAGWQVYYLPTAKIIHFGGQGGSRVQPVRSIIEWHRSYWIYYRKHLAREYFFLFNWFYYGLIGLKLSLALIINFFRKEKFAGPRRP
jgi:GT2 family glycosyltransferase